MKHRPVAIAATAGLTIALGAAHALALELVPASTGLDFPRDRVERISSEAEVQGVAHDERHWYISNNKSVTKIPLTVNLNNIPNNLPTFRIPKDLSPKWDHIGDVDQADGYLYVPLEGPEPKLLVVRTDTMTEYARFTLSPRGDTPECPWVAIDPQSGLITTSTFNISAAALQQLRVYRIDPGFKIVVDHTIVLADAAGRIAGASVAHVQGGAFSKDGTLYLVSDAQDGSPAACDVSRLDAMGLGCHGLYSFGPEEPLTASETSLYVNAYGAPVRMRRLQSFTPIERTSKKINLLFTSIDVSQELEGLDVFDLAPGIAPGISGLVHVMMSHADSGLQHSFWFKHYQPK